MWVCVTWKRRIFLNNFFRNVRLWRRKRRLQRPLMWSRSFFFTRNRSWISWAPYVQRSPVSCYTPARLANVHYTSVRVNYELYGRSCQKMTYIRSGLRERASTSVALTPGSPLCRVAEREMVGPSWKKKGFVGHRLPLHAKIPALVRITLWESREKETEPFCACIENFYANSVIYPSRVSYALILIITE